MMRRTLATVALAWLLGIGSTQVAFGQSPSLSSDTVGVGGRVELPEHRLALTLPDGWAWARYGGEDLDLLADRFASLPGGPALSDEESRWMLEGLDANVVLVATPGWGVVCYLLAYPTDLSLAEMAANDKRSIREAEEAGFGQPETDTTVPYLTFTDVSLPAGDAYRVDMAFAGTDMTLQTSDYTLLRDGTAVFITFATSGERPLDHWLSIAQTLELLPEA